MEIFKELYNTSIENLEPYNILNEDRNPRSKNNFPEDALGVYTSSETINGHTVKNNRIFVDNRGSKALIVVGESWTYGDSLDPYVSSTKGIDNVRYRLSSTFTGILGSSLQKPDLYFLATPGSSDISILKDLITCLTYIGNANSYEEILVVVQLTDPIRSNHLGFPEFFTPVGKYFSNSSSKVKWQFENYFREYEKDILDLLQVILEHFKVERRNCVVWKNFCEFENDVQNYSFKVIDTPCWRYMCELSGTAVKLPKSPNPKFYGSLEEYPILLDSQERLIEEVDLLEQGIKKLQKSLFNNWHLNELGHAIWASKLCDKLKK